MRTVMVRYKVKAGKAAENEAYIKGVFEQLNREKPDGLHYGSFKLEDGVSFVHLAWHDRPDSSALVELAAFKDFTAQIRERCEEPPVQAILQEVGSYSLFGN
jgi:hypothetical protein